MNLRSFSRILILLFGLVVAMPAFCVTKQEMEQARVIAAKAYIRYVNDGSGYLDELNPKTIEELEKSLKTKEKENIKAFLAIPVPNDYGSWDKDKLIEYWAVTAFKNKGLQEKGRGGRIRARAQINKMTITPPSSSQQTSSVQKTEAPKPVTLGEDTAKITPATKINEEKADSSMTSTETSILDQLDNVGEDLDVEKEANYTWVYIMALAILVALIIVLVVYANKVLKKNAEDTATKYREEDSNSESLERYEAIITDKDIEIAMLNKKLESATRQNNELKTKLEALISEVEALRAHRQSTTEKSSTEVPISQKKDMLRSIYLGRANAKGIFVRADRTLNIGHSIFILDTTDGYSGTFRVADSPAAWSLALSNPQEYLYYACTGYDLANTTSASKIVTESSGTAVFEGGCWKVIRKARIRYE